MNITCKAVKIHNFSARDFVTYFLICAGGVKKSLAVHQLIASFPISKEHISILSRKSSNLILNTNSDVQVYFECISVRFGWVVTDVRGLPLSSVCSHLLTCYSLLNCTFQLLTWHLYQEQSWCDLVSG